MTDEEQRMLARFEERKALNKPLMLDNSSLYAGSPMYYYCKHCHVQTCALPESHTSAPITCCESCKELVRLGLIP